MSKRTIRLSETRKNIHYVHNLKAWLDLLPPTARLVDLRSFDGDTTVTWEEQR